MLVDLGAPARRAQRGVGVGEREMAALRIHDVDVELVLESSRNSATDFVVERDAFGREIVGADDGGVARRVAAGELAAFEHGDIGDAVIASRGSRPSRGRGRRRR